MKSNWLDPESWDLSSAVDLALEQQAAGGDPEAVTRVNTMANIDQGGPSGNIDPATLPADNPTTGPGGARRYPGPADDPFPEWQKALAEMGIDWQQLFTDPFDAAIQEQVSKGWYEAQQHQGYRGSYLIGPRGTEQDGIYIDPHQGRRGPDPAWGQSWATGKSGLDLLFEIQMQLSGQGQNQASPRGPTQPGTTIPLPRPLPGTEPAAPTPPTPGTPSGPIGPTQSPTTWADQPPSTPDDLGDSGLDEKRRRGGTFKGRN